MPENAQSDLMLRSSLLIAASRGSALIFLLACTPIIIHFLGTEGYALWEVLVSYYAAISLIQISAGSVSLWKFAKCYESDRIELLKSFGSLTGMFLIASSIVALVFILISPVITSNLADQTELISDATYAIPWMAALGLLATFNQIMLSLITASNRSGTAATIQSIGTIISCLTSLSYLAIDKSIYAMPFGLTMGMLATFGLANYSVKKRLKISLPLLRFPSKNHLATYSIYAGTTTLASLTVLARDQTDRLLTASYSAINEVAHMAISQRVTNSLMELSMVILVPMSAVVGNLYAQNRRKECTEVYRRYCSITTIAIGAASLIIWVLHQHLFTLWLGTSHTESTPYLFWGLLGTLIAVSTSAPAAVLARAVGLPRLELYAGITTLILLLICKPFALQWYGSIGLCACSAICWAMGSIALMVLANRHFPEGSISLRSDLKATAYTSILIILCYLLIPTFSTSGRMSSAAVLILASPLIIVAYLSLLYLLNVLHPSVVSTISRRIKQVNSRLLSN